MSFIAFGKYKHVRAFGYVPFLHVWVFFDPCWRNGIRIAVAADGVAANAMIGEWVEGADIIRIAQCESARGMPILGWCVPSVRRLIGIRSRALRPDTLYQDCLLAGGMLYVPA